MGDKYKLQNLLYINWWKRKEINKGTEYAWFSNPNSSLEMLEIGVFFFFTKILWIFPFYQRTAIVLSQTLFGWSRSLKLIRRTLTGLDYSFTALELSSGFKGFYLWQNISAFRWSVRNDINCMFSTKWHQLYVYMDSREKHPFVWVLPKLPLLLHVVLATFSLLFMPPKSKVSKLICAGMSPPAGYLVNFFTLESVKINSDSGFSPKLTLPKGKVVF